MSHQGLQILYHILNQDSRFIAHRAYVPDVDMEQEMVASGLPLFTLEAKVPVSAYDVLGITLPYELCYTNILTALHLAGMPARAKDRDSSHPLVIGGGACALNPEPVADFFDAIVHGDGEEIIAEFRITSYNVCYTQLLRPGPRILFSTRRPQVNLMRSSPCTTTRD